MGQFSQHCLVHLQLFVDVTVERDEYNGVLCNYNITAIVAMVNIILSYEHTEIISWIP